MPANAMGRRATVMVPPPIKKNGEGLTAEAGAEFEALMKKEGLASSSRVNRTEELAAARAEDTRMENVRAEERTAARRNAERNASRRADERRAEERRSAERQDESRRSEERLADERRATDRAATERRAEQRRDAERLADAERTESQRVEATEARGEQESADRAETKVVVPVEKTQDSNDAPAKAMVTMTSEVNAEALESGRAMDALIAQVEGDEEPLAGNPRNPNQMAAVESKGADKKGPVLAAMTPALDASPQLEIEATKADRASKGARSGQKLTEQMLNSMSQSVASAEAGQEQQATQARATQLGQAVDNLTARLARAVDTRGAGQSPSAQESGDAELEVDAGMESENSDVESIDVGDLDAPEIRQDALASRARRAGGNSGATQLRAAAGPAVGLTSANSSNPSLQATSRLAEGMEVYDAGAPEQDPVEGSVKLNGVRGARLAVAMDDGSVVRARLDLVDNAVDVAIRASDDVGLRADQRVSELREALAEKGIDLGEFDVQADANENDAAGAESGDAQAREGEGGENGESEPRDLEAELEELRTENGFGYYDEGGRGALLNRRL